MADDLLPDGLLTQDHKRLREYHAALIDAWRAYQEQQPVGPDLEDVLADAAVAVADKEQQALRAEVDRLTAELEKYVGKAAEGGA